MSRLGKSISVLILLLVLVSQLGAHFVLLADYYANRSYYLENCENRYRPQLHCNGQCILMKKLRKSESQQEKEHSVRVEWKLEYLSRKSYFPEVPAAPLIVKTSFPLSPACRLPEIPAGSVFHPPSLAGV